MSTESIKESTAKLNIPHTYSVNIEDSISVLEEKLKMYNDPKAENYNWIAYELLLLQLNQLKKLKDKYDKFIEDDLLTKQTKDKLWVLFWQLHETVKSWKQVNNDIARIWSELKNERGLKKDTILWKMDITDAIDFQTLWKVDFKEFLKNHINFRKLFSPTIRDYVEKHIKFDWNFITWSLNKVRETNFMTYFYDTFTVKYLDYLYTSDDKETLALMHMNLDARNWLVISEELIDDLISKTLNNMLERWIKPDEWIVSIKIISNWQEIKRDILKIALIEIKKVTDHKVKVIRENIDNLNDSSKYWDFKKNITLIKKLDSYIKNIIPVENRGIANILIDTIKDTLFEKTIIILNKKYKEIESIINKLDNTESWEIINKIVWMQIIEMENIFDLINNDITEIKNDKFDIVNKKKLLSEKFEKKMQDLEKKEFLESIENELEKIKKLIDSIKGDNIWDTLRKIDEIEKNIWKKLHKSNIITKSEKTIIEKKVDTLDDNMVDKLLYTYLNDLWKEVIADRADISDTDLFYKLTNSLDSWSITKNLMRRIVEQWYYYAFVNELKWINWEKILERMKKNELVWKQEFWKELSWLINRKKAEDLFVMSLVESNANPFAKSEKWAKGYFQMLPKTADEHWMTSEADLSKPKKSAELAASYLWELMQTDKWKPEEIIIANALLRYNWWWSTRLNKEYTKDIKWTILEITKTLYNCKSQLLTWQINEKEALDIITKTHIEYFDISKVTKWLYHFSILDERAKWIPINKEYIIWWIDTYTKDVLNQQYMYPEQFKAAKRAYEYHKNKW